MLGIRGVVHFLGAARAVLSIDTRPRSSERRKKHGGLFHRLP